MTGLIDISHYQDPINWQQAAGDADGFYIKTTEGTNYVDPEWTQNWNDANLHGKPMGAYHFADMLDPVAEANHFANVYLTASWELRPVLDYEGNTNETWLRAFRSQFRSRVGSARFRVYASEGVLNGYLGTSWVDDNTDIWAARYNTVLGWNHPNLVLWQYTSSAHEPGFLGTVDRDAWMNGWTPQRDINELRPAIHFNQTKWMLENG